MGELGDSKKTVGLLAWLNIFLRGLRGGSRLGSTTLTDFTAAAAAAAVALPFLSVTAAV